MATNFPTSIDALTNPLSTDGLNSPDHAAQHANVNDAVEAIEAAIGTTAAPVLATLASPTFTGTPTLPTGTIAVTQTAADSSTKVATTAFVAAESVAASPIGMITAYAGSTAPSSWLLCFGQAISRSTYASLFAALSTTYGSGDGSTTFNIPDMRGRAIAGVDNMGGTAASRLTSTVLTASNTLGATGGTQTHTLTTAELASHNHTQDSHNHTQSSHNHTQDSHNHTQSSHNHTQDSHNHTQNSHDHTVVTYEGTEGNEGGTGDLYYSRRGDLTYQPLTTNGATATNQATTATNQATTATNTATTATNQATTATNTATTATNQAAGGGSAHLNTQPTLVLNYIIRAT